MAEIPATIAAATTDQPAARLALAAAAAAPSHAYLLAGPPGAGKRAAARALAAELLAAGAADPADTRRRALADPSPHPDLVWLSPPGTQHLVDEVREQVIYAAAYRPFEAERRVFVIDAADAMAEESQNALLKTLEEPAPFAHLLLISAEPEALLETVRSRCRRVRFERLPPGAIEARLTAVDASEAERRAVARLAGGDAGRANLLLTEEGRALRGSTEACARAARAGDLGQAPWLQLLEAAEAVGERAGADTRLRLLAASEESGEGGREARRSAREAEDAAKRSTRSARTATLDLALALIGAWVRDLAAVGEGAPELVFNSDRAEALAADAQGLDPRRARRGAELVMDTRRRLGVNVAEELALEALCFRLERLLHG